MDDRLFATVTRLAAGRLSRRASLVSLSAAGVTALADPARIATGKSASKKARQQCQRQQDQCVAVLTPACNGNAECQVKLQGCCALVATCDLGGFIRCLREA